MKEEIKHKLEFYPSFRERKNRNLGLAKILKNKYHVDIGEEKLTSICEDFENMSRIWRQILQRNPKLRGTDYDDKTVLSQNKQIALEYESGFDELKDVSDSI